MNPIIGTLVNGENNITTNQSFCLVLGLYLAAWKDKQNLYTYPNRFSVQREFGKGRREIVH